ncbi:MAG: hypothetical protein II131_04390 [Neisseriaceae bacterium]|nr:hypothetical protein [Neisseriaceae bacterium]
MLIVLFLIVFYRGFCTGSAAPAREVLSPAREVLSPAREVLSGCLKKTTA